MNRAPRCNRLVMAVAVLLSSWIPAAYGQQMSEGKILKLGVRRDAPPFSFEDQHTNDFKGYSVDLCKRIGIRAKNELGYDDFKFVPVTSQSRFEQLEDIEDKKDKKVDILCGATTVTLGRLKSASASLYTFLSGASFMYARPENSDGKGKLRIGVLRKTTTKENFEATIWPTLKTDLQKLGFRFSGFELKPMESHWQASSFFHDKKIDIYVADREILLALRKLAGAYDLNVSTRYYTIEPYALFTRRDDVELLYIANETLRDLYLEKNTTDNIKSILQENFRGQIFSDTLLNLFKIQRILD
jgi:polar amino acid transport system substrate-binding protein